jgi:aminopeptidase
MTDQRVARLARLLAGYSLELRRGQVLRIDAPTAATPLTEELYRAALEAGSLPYVNVELESLPEILTREGSGEQIDFVSPLAEEELERIDAIATIWAESNTRALSGAEPERHQRLIAASRRLTNKRWERISARQMRWCGVLYPTAAHAQEAGMSLGEYERFVYRACHVEEDGDPVAHWEATHDELGRRAEQLGHTRELRVVGAGTDLRVVVEGRTWEAADGRYNMPDGEVYTSPVETATEGEVHFSFPALFQGREVEDIHLRFSEGRVVDAEARRGDSFLEALLDMDEGARRLGEVSFGLNYEIDRFTKNTLFDEKIGGTMHFALGSAFTELGGRNESGLHWDLVCDLRAEGEVFADGELVWRAGAFLQEPAPAAEAVQR